MIFLTGELNMGPYIIVLKGEAEGAHAASLQGVASLGVRMFRAYRCEHLFLSIAKWCKEKLKCMLYNNELCKIKYNFFVSSQKFGVCV